MELIETELSEFTRRSRSLVVTHAGAGLTRGLEHGERVLVLSGDDYRVGVVVDIDFDLTDTSYRLILGGVVPADLARGHLAGAAPATHRPERVSVADVADMLARSGAGHRIPMQRQAAEHLLDR